ncbi:MinD/ParA family protein [Alkalicoccus chagannorensis]|uniref:MinD/ParA family protein n=1 Tax=Alkalicoccus chagannorensis TaxID=427072 RepID=UPI000422A31C|nr:MinD/ParA family protein [Alkalicoccus chagannorensis]
MSDQAEALRSKLLNRSSMQRNTKVISVVSGKGGVGKSNVTISAACELQQNGSKVLIIDLDIGMANIDILLGESADQSIVDMLQHQLSIWSIMEEGPAGISYIAGGRGLNELFEMDENKANYFVDQIASLQGAFDFVFLDMGAGVTQDSFHFLLSAQEVLLVTTPEPTSITDAYAMIKFLTVKEADLPVSVIVNRTNNQKEGYRTFDNLQQVTKKFLHQELYYYGSIPNDDAVWKAVRAQTPFVLYAPHSPPAEALRECIRSMTGGEADQTRSFPSFVRRLKGFLRGARS